MEQKVLNAYSQGLNNRQIAKEVGCHHRTVAYWLSKNGFKSNLRKGVRINVVSSNQAKCSKCGDIKPLLEFQYGRKGQKYEYRFSYCNKCRKQQSYANLNRSVEAFLKDKFNRLKIRSTEKEIPLEIDYQYLIDLYNNQNGRCFYTDQLMLWGVLQGNKLREKISIDKIVPERGYIKGNVVLCTHKANTIKSDITLEEMKVWMPDWYKRVVELWRSQGLFVFDCNQSGLNF